MSVEAAKQRLAAAQQKRNAVASKEQQTQERLAAIEQQQDEIAQKIFMQGGVDIYRQNQQIRNSLELQNEKITRATAKMERSSEAIKRAEETIRKVDIDSLAAIAQTLKELDQNASKAYDSLIEIKRKNLEEAVAALDEEYQAKVRVLDGSIAAKEKELQDLAAEIDARKSAAKQEAEEEKKALGEEIKELQAEKISVAAKNKLEQGSAVIFLYCVVMLIASMGSILGGWGLAKIVMSLVAFVAAHWITLPVIVGGLIIVLVAMLR